MTGVLIAAVAAIVLWLVYELAIKKERAAVQTALPPELSRARIWAKERDFQCDEPVALAGRIDEAFLMQDGPVVLADGKSRAKRRVYASDVLQLSAYRFLIEQTARKKVSGSAYVRLFTPEGNEYRKVDLLDADEVIAATMLHDDLRGGRYPGKKCGKPEVCRSCAYQEPCAKMD